MVQSFYIHTYIRTYIHTYIHTYICTYVHTPMCSYIISAGPVAFWIHNLFSTAVFSTLHRLCGCCVRLICVLRCVCPNGCMLSVCPNGCMLSVCHNGCMLSVLEGVRCYWQIKTLSQQIWNDCVFMWWWWCGVCGHHRVAHLQKLYKRRRGQGWKLSLSTASKTWLPGSGLLLEADQTCCRDWR